MTSSDPVSAPPAQVIGSVIEKVTRRDGSQQQGCTQRAEQGTAEAFPLAQHRKQSKFSLARRAKLSRTSPEPASSSIAQCSSSSVTQESAEKPVAPNLAPASAQCEDDGHSLRGPTDEAATVQEIKDQNDAFVAKLSPYEVP